MSSWLTDRVSRRLEAAAVATTVLLGAGCSSTMPHRALGHAGWQSAAQHGSGSAVSPGAARPALPGGSATTGPAGEAVGPASGAAPDTAPWGDRGLIASPERFGATYAVTGRLVVSYLGIDHDVSPPPTAESSWEHAIATVFVRGETQIGQLGFSLGFDAGLDHLRQLVLFVPASQDPAHPADGYVNLPLRHPLLWTGAGVATTTTSDGTWDVSVSWPTRRSLRVRVSEATGHTAPAYLHHGTLVVTATGPAGDVWRALAVQFDMHGRATLRGQLRLAPAST